MLTLRESSSVQVLWFLESAYFVLFSCVLVCVDLSFSTQDDTSRTAITLMVRSRLRLTESLARCSSSSHLNG